MLPQLFYFLFSLVPIILILIGCILLYNNTKQTTTLIMLIAIAINIIPLIVNSIPPAIMHCGVLSYQAVNIIYGIMKILNFLAYTAFGISLFVFVKNYVMPKYIIH